MDNEFNNDAINPSFNNRKTQTFNLIIGIATLLIAILGATFAYFSATARSSEGEVTVKSAMVSINFDRGTEIKASNLIPSTQKVALSKYQKSEEPFVETETEKFMKDYDDYVAGNDHTRLSDYADRRCIDANLREVCYVFWFTVRSDGQEGENTDILAYIDVEKNEFENLSYMVYEVSYATEEEKIQRDKYGFGIVETYQLASDFPVDTNAPVVEEYGYAKFGKVVNVVDESSGSAVVKVVKPVACLFGEVEDTSDIGVDDRSRCKPYSISNGVDHYYQVVIWLEETRADQQEQGKTFKGTVAVEISGDAGASIGQITGQE